MRLSRESAAIAPRGQGAVPAPGNANVPFVSSGGYRPPQATPRTGDLGTTPFVIRGKCTPWPAYQRWADPEYLATRFSPERGQQMLSISCSAPPRLQKADAKGQASAAPAKNGSSGGAGTKAAVGSYSGRSLDQDYVQVPIQHFFDYYRQSKRGALPPHYLETTGQEYYLCQCPLVRPREPGSVTPANQLLALDSQLQQDQHLAELFPDVQVPEEIAPHATGQPLQAVSVWISVNKSRSGLHYDCNHNLLCVVVGQKTVTLFPPSDTAKLHPAPVYSESCNHTLLAPNADFAPSPERQGSVFVLGAGDALFIPEGWWHTVESTSHTIGVNFWWSGLRPSIEMPLSVPYVLRVAMVRAIRMQRETLVAERLGALRATTSPAALIAELRSALAIEDKAAFARALLRIPLDSMVDGLPDVITGDPAKWTTLVCTLSPLDVECLTLQWEDVDVPHVSSASCAQRSAPTPHTSTLKGNQLSTGKQPKSESGSSGRPANEKTHQRRRQFFSVFFQTQTSTPSNPILQHFKNAKELLNKSIYADVRERVFGSDLSTP